MSIHVIICGNSICFKISFKSSFLLCVKKGYDGVCGGLLLSPENHRKGRQRSSKDLAALLWQENVGICVFKSLKFYNI